ncbi:MAG: N-acetylneuraminate synthase [Bdellovibrionales bacterium]|nr:N-acetylneuraminate synthase [Bdellovibrionales bacterium]
MSDSVFIIAEAGVNHNGSLERAQRMIRVAKDAGADAIKFQTFKSESVVTKTAGKALYQKKNTGSDESQYEMIKKLELDQAAHQELWKSAKEIGIEILSTPFDLESLRFLAHEVKVSRIKIASGEITNAPLLMAAARTGVPIILSTGMSTLDDIRAALGVIAFGYCEPSLSPSPKAFSELFLSENARRVLRGKVSLMHCTTSYPTPPEDVNLMAIQTLRDEFSLPVGLSDHSMGTTAAAGAVALGASMVEKHFTLDKSLPGPDHRASLDPSELECLVRTVRDAEAMRGLGIKAPVPSEVSTMAVVRRSLVAARPIRRGEPFSPENLTVKRPGTGVSPMLYWSFLGKPAARAYDADDLIDERPQ